MSCPQCGSDNLPTNLFCARCGAKLTPANPDAVQPLPLPGSEPRFPPPLPTTATASPPPLPGTNQPFPPPVLPRQETYGSQIGSPQTRPDGSPAPAQHVPGWYAPPPTP